MKAAALYQRVAADRSRVLGDDHPDTLWSRASVAFSYTMAGRAQEAVPMIDEVVADQERALPPDHPTLLAARYFQACTNAEEAGPSVASSCSGS
ncbi:tetratricopeptide repeat protein [Nonomuraea thailandensis]